MASEFSFDIVAAFDMQEVRNAVDQTKRELTNRYDFKDVSWEVELKDETVEIVAAGEMKVKAIYDVLLQKVINRKLSPKVLEKGEPEATGGMNFKMSVKLVKALTQEKCKIVSKVIKDNFPKVKGSIQGAAVRCTSKSKDDLQLVMNFMRGKEEEIGSAVMFENFR